MYKRQVEAFVQVRLSFLEVAELVEEAMDAHKAINAPDLDDIFETDRGARECLLEKHPALG